jgi:hypothetical protein
MPTVPLNTLGSAPGAPTSLAQPDETSQWMALAQMQNLGRIQDPDKSVAKPPRRGKPRG